MLGAVPSPRIIAPIANLPSDDAAHSPAEPTRPLPSPLARGVAVAVIVLAGVCGGLIGYAVTDLQCDGDCGLLVGIGALLGAVLAAGGVAVVAVLALRAMAEWDTVQERERRT